MLVEQSIAAAGQTNNKRANNIETEGSAATVCRQPSSC